LQNVNNYNNNVHVSAQCGLSYWLFFSYSYSYSYKYFSVTLTVSYYYFSVTLSSYSLTRGSKMLNCQRKEHNKQILTKILNYQMCHKLKYYHSLSIMCVISQLWVLKVTFFKLCSKLFYMQDLHTLMHFLRATAYML